MAEDGTTRGDWGPEVFDLEQLDAVASKVRSLPAQRCVLCGNKEVTWYLVLAGAGYAGGCCDECERERRIGSGA